MALPPTTDILLEHRPSGVLLVTLNTPKTLNSFDGKKYRELISALAYAASNASVKALLLTANGKYFSSGAALSQDRIAAIRSGKTSKLDSTAARDLIDALIEFPKLLVAGLQGPAYGIAVTMLPFFDLIYASPNVTFTTPFSKLGICLEGCSSVLFPQLLGKTLSTRLLYLAQTVPVADMASTGMIAEVLPHGTIISEVVKRTEQALEGLFVDSIITSKRLVRDDETRQKLHRVNNAEMSAVAGRMQTEDYRTAIDDFEERRRQRKGTAVAKL